MSQENEMTGQESLSIIQNMINAAKQEQRDNGMGWIIWGWMLFLTSITTIANIHFNWFKPFFFWNMFGLFSVAMLTISVVRKFVSKKHNEVRTYFKDLFKILNIGFFISLAFIIVEINISGKIILGFALLMNLYAFWMLIYGAASNFKPSIIAAFITWGLGFVCLHAKTFEQVMYLQAAASFIGYIIPGYLANRAFNKNK